MGYLRTSQSKQIYQSISRAVVIRVQTAWHGVYASSANSSMQAGDEQGYSLDGPREQCLAADA